MGLDPAWSQAWIQPEVGLDDDTGQHGRGRAGRIVALAVIGSVALAVALPRVVDAAEPRLTTRPASEEIVRVMSDAAGHRLDGGFVREVETSADGTVWVAVGRRVLALGTPGATHPRTSGPQAFPRRLSTGVDGSLRAVEDGGEAVTLTESGWVAVEPALPGGAESPVLEEAALELLRAQGIEHLPRVLADVEGPGLQRWVAVDVSLHPDLRPAEYRLLRFDGERWTILDPDESRPRGGQRAWTVPGPQAPVALAVDQAGRAWFSLDHHGLWVADDDGFERVRFPGLGSGALDLAGTPDGAVWIATIRGGLYRWSPTESVAL